MEAKKPYLLICEGDSEFAYVQELNRFLAKRGVPVVFLPHNAGGGGFGTVRRACRKLKTKRDGRTFVVADRDIYFRNDNGNGTAYERGKHLVPPFLFQTWNFEDFLLMHFPPALLVTWREEALRAGHSSNPLHRRDYMPLFTAFCSQHNDVLKFSAPYEKGDMPFELHPLHLERLVANNGTSVFPFSAFVEFLEQILSGQEQCGDLSHALSLL
jgi:hypothetical protein